MCGCRSSTSKHWRCAVAAEQSLEAQVNERTLGVSAYERQHQYDERNIRRPKNHHEGHLLHRARNDLHLMYDRWTNGLVRSCWNSPYRCSISDCLHSEFAGVSLIAGIRVAINPKRSVAAPSQRWSACAFASLCREWRGRCSMLAG